MGDALCSLPLQKPCHHHCYHQHHHLQVSHGMLSPSESHGITYIIQTQHYRWYTSSVDMVTKHLQQQTPQWWQWLCWSLTPLRPQSSRLWKIHNAIQNDPLDNWNADTKHSQVKLNITWKEDIVTLNLHFFKYSFFFFYPFTTRYLFPWSIIF